MTENSRRLPRHRVQAIRTTASCCSALRRHTTDAAHRRKSPVTKQSVTALTADNRPIGLLELENHLLDRQRTWAGTGGKTLKDLGYGFLGQYRWHVKDHINRLLNFGHHTCIDDPLEPSWSPPPSCTAAITRACQGGRYRRPVICCSFRKAHHPQPAFPHHQTRNHQARVVPAIRAGC